MPALLLFPASLGQAVASGPPEGLSPPDPTSVVVVIFDELPLVSLLDSADEIDARLYPNFAGLAGDSVWYRNATTVASFTDQALPSLLTGRYPSRRGLHLLDSLGANMFTILDPTHEVRSPSSFPGLCPVRQCKERSLAPRSAPNETRLFETEARGRPLAGFSTLLERREEPCLCVLHLVMPHSPWRYLPSGQRYPGTNPIPGQAEMPGPGRTWIDDPWLVKQAYQRHLLQVGYADVLLGEVVAQLEEAGRYDEALVVVTADHGVAFDSGRPKRDPRPSTAGQIAAVPLFIKAPGPDGARIDDQPAELIDVVPTLADMLGMGASGPSWDGSSLLRARSEADRFLGGIRLEPDGRDRLAALHRKVRDFDLERWRDIFAVAPGRMTSHLGAPVPATPSISDIEATIENMPALETSDGKESEVPVLVKGSIEPGNEGTTLGLSIDGRIAGITRSYEGPNGRGFYLLIPPEALRGPPHEIGLWIWQESGWQAAELIPSS